MLFCMYGHVINSQVVSGTNGLEPQSVNPNKIGMVYGEISNNLHHKKLKQAQVFIDYSQPDKALPLLFELLQSKNVHADTVQLCNILIADAYRQKREYKKGISLLNSVLAVPNLDIRNRAHAYNRLAALYNELDTPLEGRRDSAVYYSLLTVEISKQNGFTNLLASSQNELGYIFRLRGEFTKAEEYCKRAYQNFRQLKLYPNAINTAINLCGTYLKTGEFNEALTLIDSAALLTSEKQYKSLYMRLYLRKSDILLKKKDFEGAFYAQKKARELQEDFFNHRMGKQASEMAAKYDLKLKEQQIIDSEQQNKIQRQQKAFILVLLIVLIIAFIITIYNFRLQRKIRAQKQALVEQENAEMKTNLKLKEQELKFKNKELSQALTNMIAYNDALAGIKKAVKENKNAEVMEIITGKQHDNHMWQKFKRNFFELHPDFFAKLDNQYPQLTENDRRLCSFLLMDMKTAEIGTVLNITQAAVSKSRNRIRKKLNLQQGADIKAFLHSL